MFDGAWKEDRLLLHERDVLPEKFRVQSVNINVVKFELTVGRVIKSFEHCDHGAFAATGRTHEGYELSLLDLLRRF